VVREAKRFRVIGHPRGGKRYMAALLQALGYQVAHEVMGRDGISHPYYAANSAERTPFAADHRGPALYRFATTIHAVREPLASIGSIVGSERGQASLGFRQRNVLLDVTLPAIPRAVMSWVGWHRLCRNAPADITVCVETAADTLPSALKAHGYAVPEQFTPPPQDTGHELTSERLTWGEVMAATPSWLWEELRREAALYGYTVLETGNA